MRLQSRSWTSLVVLVILIAVVGGAAFLLLRGGEETPEPVASPSLVPTELVLPSPTPLPLPTATPAPYVYVVQEGDTMYSIAAVYGLTLEELVAANDLADPSLIRPGDELIIPGMAAPTPAQPLEATAVPPTAIPRPVMPTATPAGPPVFEIAGVLGAGNLEAEAVRIRNQGGPASLEGWSLSDSTGNEFVFPRLVLFPGVELTIHTIGGISTPTHLYWGRGEPVWDPGELIVLRDAAGETVDTYIVP